MLPASPSLQIGIAGFVINDKREVSMAIIVTVILKVMGPFVKIHKNLCLMQFK